MDTNERILQRQFSLLDPEVIMAAYSERDVGWTDSRDGMDFYRFVYATEGKAVVEINGVTHNIEPKRLYLLRPKTNETYEITVQQKAKLYWCHFSLDTQDFKFIKLLRIPFTASVPLPDGEFVINIILRMMDAFNQESITSPLRLKAAILELMSFYIDNSALMLSKANYYEMLESGEKWAEVIDYIEKNLHHNIQIEDLAKVAYLHPNYLITSFKTVMGCSPIQYVTERRLEMAKKLLKETDLPISDIASKVGMLNHYLPRLLKRQTGITPKQYRRLMQVDIHNIKPGDGNNEVTD
ncbi:AraC family transcriptional regulator [Paenibacillus lupini]|uniref:AraC family transcriptional regulator n=1 Tax=Paenibacillus lupini TaxID=1450204 RepID=UPI00141F5450|nr:AraC family transcriptional regulator [Paenibacillus lupini]NIK23963.1 AraC-like DNA-binding protein [Paenibacillus lupini]